MASRYEVVSKDVRVKDPNKGVITTFDTVRVTVHDTQTGKSATGTGHCPHSSSGGSVEVATREAIEDAQRKLK